MKGLDDHRDQAISMSYKLQLLT